MDRQKLPELTKNQVLAYKIWKIDRSLELFYQKSKMAELDKEDKSACDATEYVISNMKTSELKIVEQIGAEAKIEIKKTPADGKWEICNPGDRKMPAKHTCRTSQT